MVADAWAAEWQAAGRTGAGMVEEEQADWQLVAMVAIAVSLTAKTAQLAVLAAGMVVGVRWHTWAMAREVTSRRLHTNMSAAAAILLDHVEISLA